MSSSKTAISRGKNVSSVGMKAQWDQPTKESFIHACVEELGGAGYKNGTVLTKVGWDNVVTKFNQRTGKCYDRVQLKNQWGVLKKDWQLWQHLVAGETRLGKDPDTSAITASDDWWALKLMRHPDCAKFREKPLPLEDEMRIVFGCNTATGELSYTPSSGILPGIRNTPNVDAENIDALLEDEEKIQELVHPTELQKKRRANGSVTKKTVGKEKNGSATSRLEACLQQIVDSTGSANSPSVTRAVEIPTFNEATAALNELSEFKDDNDLWARAYNILGGANQRAMFMACPDNEKRYCWLTHEMTRMARVEFGDSTWFAPTSSNPDGL